MNCNPKSEEAYKLLHEGVLALARAEQAGIRIDVAYVEQEILRLKLKIEQAEINFKNSKFYKDWKKSVNGEEVNVNSHTQLAHYLYDVLGYEPEKLTPSGKGTTDKEALLNLKIPEFTALLEKNKIKKLIDVLEGFYGEQVDGVLHTNFNLHLVVSYRSSSSDPNMQNIPKRDEEAMQTCRKAIYPRPGHQLLEIDFKGIEVAINACYNKDSTLIKYVSDPTTDMHRDMACQIFKLDEFNKEDPTHQVLRQAAKNGFVFPQFYGDYYRNCAVNTACKWGELPQSRWKEGQGIKMNGGFLSDHFISKGIKSFNAYVEHLKKIETDFWQNRFSEYSDWKDRWWSVYRKYGYIDFLTGFRCSGVMDKKQVCNYPGQGSAFHCLLWSLTRADEVMQEEQWDTNIIGQIHDSILFDVHPDELEHVAEIVQDITTKQLPEFWKWIIVPLSVDMEITEVDEPWSEKKKYSLQA